MIGLIFQGGLLAVGVLGGHFLITLGLLGLIEVYPSPWCLGGSTSCPSTSLGTHGAAGGSSGMVWMAMFKSFPPLVLSEPVPAEVVWCLAYLAVIISAKPSWGHGKTIPALRSGIVGSVQCLWSYISNAKKLPLLDYSWFWSQTWMVVPWDVRDLCSDYSFELKALSHKCFAICFLCVCFIPLQAEG